MSGPAVLRPPANAQVSPGNPHVPPPAIPTLIPAFIQLASGARIYSGNGVPPATLGKTGDLFARKDGGGAGLTHLYFNNGGAWIGVA